jgi:hypothetical protein
VVAFDTAGCPALLTGKELDAWIAYARGLEVEDTSQGPRPSFTEMRARIGSEGAGEDAGESTASHQPHRHLAETAMLPCLLYILSAGL